MVHDDELLRPLPDVHILRSQGHAVSREHMGKNNHPFPPRVRVPKVVAMIITSLQLVQMVVGCAVNYFAFKFKENGESHIYIVYDQYQFDTICLVDRI